MPNQVNIGQSFTYQAETITHETRVLADGGVISRKRDLDQNIVNQKQITQFNNLQLGFCASGGYKLTGLVYDKLYDYSGNNRDVTSSTTVRPTYNATGRFNRPSVEFDGVNDNLSSSAFSFPATNQISFCAWVKASTGAVKTIFNSSLQSNATGFFWLYRSGNSLIFQYRSTTSGGSNIAVTAGLFTTTIYDDVWVHISVTVDFTGNQVKFYRNGFLFQTSTLTTPVFPSDNTIKYFGSYNNGANYFIGSLDCVRIYSTILSLTDVQRILVEI